MFLFTSIVTISSPRGSWNVPGQLLLKSFIACCPRARALSALTSGWASCPVVMFISATSGWDSLLNVLIQTSMVLRRLRRSILRYFSTKGKAQSPLHHLLVVCSYSNRSSWSVSKPHVRCFHKHVCLSCVIDAWDVTNKCTTL